MNNFAESANCPTEEIQLSIYDSEVVYYGGDQHWFPSEQHQRSGCGPVAAANITAYLAQAFPEKYGNLYHPKGIINKKDFIEHMVEVREYVIPGHRGLTSVVQFTENVMSFSESRGVILTPHILDENAKEMGDAINFISEALYQKLPVAILVLRHPAAELDEFTWHWMTITRLHFDPEHCKYYISVSTYGEHKEIDFDLLWNHRGDDPEHIIRLAYFK
ncbi:hypothetical protein OXPF_08200 [Oxobacter pfennigii]|uniref:Peptidase C39-like domain-containing protein n=1 Tax=Oxobacter pfennigii TaxID=36849 RepID=A0A0P8Z0B7_9CLOT|nr:hypothetical protein [Oxobacter pfennigii]KPU45587.1 hypothetical protein OXPF_08200 [Oxobacter pfennigii]